MSSILNAVDIQDDEAALQWPFDIETAFSIPGIVGDGHVDALGLAVAGKVLQSLSTGGTIGEEEIIDLHAGVLPVRGQ